VRRVQRQLKGWPRRGKTVEHGQPEPAAHGGRQGDMCTHGKPGHAAGVDAFLNGSRLPVIVRLQLVVHVRACSVAPDTPRVPARLLDKLSGDDCLM
jgi:hypothetical protein